jgi:hypothetical protein
MEWMGGLCCSPAQQINGEEKWICRAVAFNVLAVGDIPVETYLVSNPINSTYQWLSESPAFLKLNIIMYTTEVILCHKWVIKCYFVLQIVY